MSKTKVIEIFERTQMVVQIGTDTKGRVVTTTHSADELATLNSNYINQHYSTMLQDEYDKGYKDGRNVTETQAHDDAYQRGLDDAWEAARKLFSSMADSDIEKAFPTEWNNGGFHALINLQPQEAIAKLKAYEQKRSDKIKRGDIVNVKGSCNDDLLGVVTKVWKDNCYIMWGDGSGGAWCKKSVVKTGKHIDIDKILEELRYDS